METKKPGMSLAKRMAISLVCGLAAGLAFMFLRESLISGGKSEIWTTINDLLFQDITAEGAERAFGIFYIIGQLFIKALQLVIVPMVFTSIALAIGSIADTRTMGRISAKTLFWFLLCSFPVSYTHLTLPTKRIVVFLVARVSLQIKCERLRSVARAI